MKSKSGFTVVELLVSIAVIGVLLAISIVSFSKQQVEARDQTRYSRATIIAEALEKYYEQNGEYPSVASLVSETGATGSTVAAKLKVELNTVTLPGASASITNSLTNGTPTTSKAKYTASSVNSTENTACQTSASGGCDSFTITYKKEADNSDVTIASRYSDRTAVVAPPTPPPSTPATIDAPNAPTMSTSYASNIITGTASVVSCTNGNTPEYALSTRENDGTWSAYSGWSSNRSVGLTTAQGNKYGFRAKAHCATVGDASAESAASSEATYIHPITAPSTPNPYITALILPAYSTGNVCMDANGGGSGNGTLVQIWQCNGTFAQDWAYNSNDKTIRPTYAMNMCVTAGSLGTQLTLYTCDGATSRQWNRGDSGTFQNVGNGGCMDAANWGTANGTSIGTWNCGTGNTAQLWNPADSQTAWNWPGIGCPAGATANYQIKNQTTALADSAWISTGANASTVRTTVNQGYTYTTQVQARCASAFATSPWSTTGQSSIAKAVLPPPAPYNWAFSSYWNWNGSNYNTHWQWTFAFTCGASTNRYYIEDQWINSGNSAIYWLAPRQPNGPGQVGWWTANSNGGNQPDYITFGPNAPMLTETTGYNNQPRQSGFAVSGRAQGWCVNPVTGRSSAPGPWGQGWANL